MSNKINYIILEKEALILEYYCGKFNAEELIDFKRKIGMDANYNSTFSVLSDIRDSELLFTFDEVEKYVEFLLRNQKYVGRRKTAMITKTPNQVVTSLGYDMQKKNFPMIYNIYSSFEAAYAFLGLSTANMRVVDSLMRKLKTESKCIFKLD